MRFKLCVAMLSLALLSSSSAFGAVITDAVKLAGNGTAINLVEGGLADGVDAYTDRNHVLVDVPAALIGSDLIQVSNSDKTSNPYELSITTNLGLIYIGLDDRLTSQPLSWMNDSAYTGLPDGFLNTGTQIGIDEGNNGSVDQTFTLWAALAGPGTYTLGKQDDGGSRNNYIVLGSRTLIPEPSSVTILALGLMGLISLIRRR